MSQARTEEGPPNGPAHFHIQWHITDRCNLRCLHCYQPAFSKEGELDWPSLRDIADSLLQTMAGWNMQLDVAITGGEPLIRKEAVLLLQHLDASSRIGQLGLITNGTLLAKQVGWLQAITHLDELKISIDGTTAAAHDGIRGPGEWRRVLDNLAAIRRLKAKKIAMFTLLRRNLQEAAGLLDFCRRAGFDGCIIERFFPLGQGVGQLQEVVSGEEFLALWQMLLQQTGCEAEPQELIAYRAIRVDFGPHETDISGSGCIVGSDGCAVMPDGSVLPCRRLPLPIGNLREKSLARIWDESQLLAEMRDKSRLKGGCHLCPRDECRGCRAMSFCLSGDPLGEDPHCWLER